MLKNGHFKANFPGVPVPRNFFVGSVAENFVERHDLEQYFWTDKTVHGILNALQYYQESDVCCLTTPTLAHAYHIRENDQVLLDIDERFNYLPRYRRFDIMNPQEPNDDENFSVIVIDPPFFYIPMFQIRNAVLTVTRGRTDVPLLIGFLKRCEKELLQAFGDFGIKETKFSLEYSTVKPNKWKNYALYSNVDLPGIKRCKDSKDKKTSRWPIRQM